MAPTTRQVIVSLAHEDLHRVSAIQALIELSKRDETKHYRNILKNCRKYRRSVLISFFIFYRLDDPSPMEKARLAFSIVKVFPWFETKGEQELGYVSDMRI